MIYVLFLVFLGVALAACAVSAWLRLRRQRAGVVVQTLASIISQNLPLVPAVRAAAGSERRALRRIYAQLAQRLELGDDLSTALRCAIPVCPGEVVGVLHGAERGGTLPGVLQALAARLRQEAWQPRVRSVPVWYPLLLLMVLPLVLTFFLVMVVPKFKEIFIDFDVTLPRMTVTLVEFARPVGEHAGLIIVGLLLAVLALVHTLVGRYFVTRIPDRLQPVYACWDTLAWGIPGLRQGACNYALGQQLLIMQAALRAGHDLGEAARQGVCAAVNWHARRRLRNWANALEAGTDPLAEARRLGFPASFLQALMTARADGELAARFEYLAEYYQALHRHRLRALAAAFTPVMVVAWGLLVGYVIVAIILPVVSLVQGVMGTIY